MSKEKFLENVREIKSVLSSEDKWIKGNLSLNANNVNTLPNDGDACQWCLLGAIYKVCDDGNSSEYFISFLRDFAGDDILRIMDGEGRTSSGWMAYFNDHESITYTDVMRVLDDAEKELLRWN